MAFLWPQTAKAKAKVGTTIIVLYLASPCQIKYNVAAPRTPAKTLHLRECACLIEVSKITFLSFVKGKR